jgi:hypothetical protein
MNYLVLSMQSWQGNHVQAFPNRAQYIVESPDWAPKHPCDIMTDGDLWEQFHRGSKQRPIGSVRLSKLAAHSTAVPVLDGVISFIDRDGNHAVDHIASEAWENLDATTANLHRYINERISRYVFVIASISRMIAYIFTADQIARATRDRINTQLTQNLIKVKPLFYCSNDATRPLEMYVFAFWPTGHQQGTCYFNSFIYQLHVFVFFWASKLVPVLVIHIQELRGLRSCAYCFCAEEHSLLLFRMGSQP